MRERAEIILKSICWLLVTVLLLQTVRALVRNHPFANVSIPATPTLSADTNATTAAGSAHTSTPVNSETNHPASGTNHLDTNLVAKVTTTNQAPATNFGTNLPPLRSAGETATNVQAPTNAPVQTNALTATNMLATTNALASANMLTQTNADKPRKKSSRSGPGHSPMMGMPGMGGPGKPLPELPPVVRARIDKIVDSELLGPVIHPQPKALLGIAGNVAFLRTDNGETGLVKEGDTLGDLKLLRIGINRVLIEQNGQPQELMIFSGMGGESLLTTPDKNSNETINH